MLQRTQEEHREAFIYLPNTFTTQTNKLKTTTQAL